MKEQPRALLLHYLLLGYVIIQFAWWAYLLYDLNVQLANAQNEIAGEPIATAESKLFMILGEGTVFLSLLVLAALYIRKYLLREQRLAKQERNFLLATTHELNSPLASVKLNLQTLQREGIKEEQRKRMVEGGLSGVQRLEGLVSNILMASRIDAGKLQLHLEQVDVQDIFQKIKRQFDGLVAEQGGGIKVVNEGVDTVYADARALQTMISNLVQNALKYAPGTEIEMGVREEGDKTTFWVSDHGPGIPEQERARIFQKFYRIENEETRSQKGTGLGLYLVKELVALHRGQIRTTEVKPTGLRIEVTLANKT